MRIVIELKRGEVPDVVLNNLYKHTPLQTTFGIIMLAIAGGRPRVLGAARRHRELRRVPPRGGAAAHRIRAAEGRGARPHPRRAQDRARSPRRGDPADSRVQEPGRSARGADDAFALSQVQAQAILDMQLQRLTGLERQKILDELVELMKTIERLRAILSSDELLMQLVVNGAEGRARQVRRRAAHRDHRRERRDPDRGPHRRRGHGDHGDEHRLRQADRRSRPTGCSAAAARGASACGRARRTTSRTSSWPRPTPTS